MDKSVSRFRDLKKRGVEEEEMEEERKKEEEGGGFSARTPLD